VLLLIALLRCFWAFLQTLALIQALVAVSAHNNIHGDYYDIRDTDLSSQQMISCSRFWSFISAHTGDLLAPVGYLMDTNCIAGFF
jgi:hypothetical protein